MFLKYQAIILLVATASQCNTKSLIQDCPQEKIINKMPMVGNSGQSNQYYIYKGERREISEFDSTWVSKNCKVPVIEVH